MENIKKPVLNTQDALIKYLLQSKREMQEDSKAFAKTPEFQNVLKKLREKKLKQQ
jgi:hypothetical protein